MWGVIGNISSICSIIGLPIAIWQIHELKTRVEATEKGIKQVLDIKEHEKINQIFDILARQYQEVCDLVAQVNRTGKSTQSIEKKCREISKEINRCIVEMPPEYTDILKSFTLSIEHIEKFTESDMQSNTELKDARDYLNNALQQMKREQKRFEGRAISMAAHYNE